MPNPSLTDPPVPMDAATKLSNALDRLNSCCWTKDDREALREARVARGRLKELEASRRSFSDQWAAFFKSKDNELYQADRVAHAFGIVWGQIVEMSEGELGDLAELVGLVGRERDDSGREATESVRRAMLEVVRREPMRVMGCGVEDQS